MHQPAPEPFRIGGSRAGQLFLCIDDDHVRPGIQLSQPRFKPRDVFMVVNGDQFSMMRLDEDKRLQPLESSF